MDSARPSAPLVISCIALFVALSGTAVAVKHEVGRGAKGPKIQTDDLAKNAVTGPKVAQGTVDTKDLAAGSIQHNQIGGAVVGENNMQNGSVSARTLLPLHIVKTNNLVGTGFQTAYAQCPAGEVLLSGGAQVLPTDRLVASGPDQSVGAERTWFAQMHTDEIGGAITVWAICLPADS